MSKTEVKPQSINNYLESVAELLESNINRSTKQSDVEKAKSRLSIINRTLKRGEKR